MADEEDVTARLLRLAGAPSEPAVERSARVRQAVHRAWRAQRRQRVVRRTATAVIVLGGLAAALAVAVRVNQPRAVTPPAPAAVVATEARIDGHPRVVGLDGPGGVPLTAGMAVHAGDTIETDATSRAALRTADGSSLRIDHSSKVRLIQGAVIELTGGAAYIETAHGSHGFEVRTPMGSIRDVGTQFEVRVGDRTLRLRVRTGAVQLRRGAAVNAAAAGTETTVTPAGLAVRQVPPFGPDWDWTAALAPPFEIEGRSLRAFLDHTAAERGWALRYASREAAAIADRTILHGSVDGLGAEQALDATLVASGLAYRLRAGELVVSKPAGGR